MNASRLSADTENYSNLEQYLQQMLTNVLPRQDFVTALHQRLLNMPAQKHWLPTVLFFFLITLAALVSGLILIATSLRALVTIAAALGLVLRMRSGSKNTAISSS